jgi:PKD repeat protein
MSTFTKLCAVALAAVASACTIQEMEAPALVGPSEFALRIALQASPDSILMDGGSQSVISIEATGVDGRPVRGLALRLETTDGAAIFDIGTLSAKTVVTGDDGRARVIYTAPRGTVGGVVTILVTPIGTDFRGEQPRSIQLRLVPPGVILPPNAAPVPLFTFTPTAPTTFQTVTFDASQTQDEFNPDGTPRLCGAACTYQWDFGDGTTATGIFATHQFRTVGNFLVRLTATDARGESAQTAQTITVGAGAPPTGAFTFSPANPAINEPVLFNASGVTPAPGRRIVSYEWNFGNGRTGTGVTASTSYGAVGSYNVTLTVTDDAGNRTTIGPQSITVSAQGALTASLTVSPTGGNTSTNFFFDASASRPGPSPIVEYRFNFGDNSPEVVGTSPTTTHRFLQAGSYIVRVTIRDSANRTATTTVSVTVAQ